MAVLKSSSAFGNVYYKKLMATVKGNRISTSVSLEKRKTIYKEMFERIYLEFSETIAEEVLVSQNAEEIVAQYSLWMDAWVVFTWNFVYEEEPLLMQAVFKTSDQKISYIKKNLPQKRQRQSEMETFLSENANNQIHIDPAERAYYLNILTDIQNEVTDLQMELDVLQEITPQITKKRSKEDTLLNHLVIFARGGYGREELTFSSDIDLAFCLNLSPISNLEKQTAQELIKRMEELFQEISLDVASQYFELGEDLTRFRKTEMMHAIPSILEGRVILGKVRNLDQLKKQMLEICPREKMIRYLKRQMDELLPKDNETLLIKEGFGGIRHLQYVLWMVLIVVNHECGNSRFLIGFLKEQGWISETDKINLLQSLEFYFDLRNFLGLYSFYSDRLKRMNTSDLSDVGEIRKDLLNDRAGISYLKLKQRFATVDFMDRYRLHSIQTISRLSQSIIQVMLDRIVAENLPGFILYKHLGSEEIIRFQVYGHKPRFTWNIQFRAQEKKERVQGADIENLKKLFLNSENLFDLFRYIGRTGNYLCRDLKNGLAGLIPDLYEVVETSPISDLQQFIFDLFTAENSSVVLEQMVQIAAPLDWEGNIKTLLGAFLPEANRMRFLLRNLDVHEYPLCIHSLKSLQQVEIEIDTLHKDEPELWRFISQDDIFALKWSVFFHDVGKIDPYKDHEELGPVLSTNMLVQLGWEEDSEILNLVRLLISNHQSVVRFSQLSTYLDLGILKFFELAQRDPRKVILLYLINLSDFKSVNAEMSYKAAHLENFFEKTMSILGEFKQKEFSSSITDMVNHYLDQKVDETRTSVLLELLLNQCCNKSLEDVISSSLKKESPSEFKKLETYRDELENLLVFLKLAELDKESLDKHRFRFTQTIRQVFSEDTIFSIVAPLSVSWNWFFTAIPNRYLLSSRVEVLTSQLQQFEKNIRRKIQFSYIKGERGEYDTILFHCIGETNLQAKIAYVLGWRGLNIENGKINKVIYTNGKEGWVGFFKVSKKQGTDDLSSNEIEDIIKNLHIPPLNPQPVAEAKKMLNVQLQFFPELEKGYLVKEIKNERFSRVKTDFIAVKISLYDAPFIYYKIMRSFEAVGVFPQQVTITTIGKQIIDYFYISPKEQAKLQKFDFVGLLKKYINADITVT